MELKDKIFVVTGGSSGIGLAIAIKAKEHGAKVIITGRDKKKLELAESEEGFDVYRCDNRSEEEIMEFFKKIKDKYGRIDVLVNNAGYGTHKKLEDVTSEDFDDVIATNVRGTMLMTREAAGMMKKEKKGSIVNISSTSGTKGYQGGTVYVASKFALKGMTECWRAELRPHNIRVILVNPSEVQTSFFNDASIKDPSYNPSKLRPEEIAYAVISALEMDERGFIPEFSVFATNPKD